MLGQEPVSEGHERLEKRVALFHGIFQRKGLSSLPVSELLSLSNKFSRIEHEFRKREHDLKPLRIGILSSFTTNHLVQMLKLFLYERKIEPVFYEGGFGTSVAEIMDSQSGLYRFQPEVLLLLPHHSEIHRFPALFSTGQEIDNWISIEMARISSLWDRIQSLGSCHVFQGHFVIPLHRALGSIEENYLFSPSNCLRALTLEMIRRKPSHVTFVDLDHLASTIGKEHWFDDSGYCTHKQGIAMGAIPAVCWKMARLLGAKIGQIRKCLVVDLDNTIWGGVIGDDGLEGIKLDPNDPIGEAFRAFQRYLLELKNRGVLLAVCSKNFEEMARAPFVEHPDMLLKMSDISCFLANWDDKPDNLRRIAERLNIGLDSLVFFDDNPSERDIVRRFLPEVEVVDVPEDPAWYVRALDQCGLFDWGQVTREDLSRTETFVSGRQREELQAGFQDYDSYLRALNMRACIGQIGDLELERCAQLINKSNQFNLRTQRYSAGNIESMTKDGGHWIPLFVRFSDKFGDYGIISVVLLQCLEDFLFIDTWVMSCRVLKRGIEMMVLNACVKFTRERGKKWLIGEFLPTKKNALVESLLPDLGFEAVPEGWFRPGEGGIFRLETPSFVELAHCVGVEYQAGN